jgi:hypothetical protein
MYACLYICMYIYYIIYITVHSISFGKRERVPHNHPFDSDQTDDTETLHQRAQDICHTHHATVE